MKAIFVAEYPTSMELVSPHGQRRNMLSTIMKLWLFIVRHCIDNFYSFLSFPERRLGKCPFCPYLQPLADVCSHALTSLAATARPSHPALFASTCLAATSASTPLAFTSAGCPSPDGLNDGGGDEALAAGPADGAVNGGKQVFLRLAPSSSFIRFSPHHVPIPITTQLEARNSPIPTPPPPLPISSNPIISKHQIPPTRWEDPPRRS